MILNPQIVKHVVSCYPKSINEDFMFDVSLRLKCSFKSGPSPFFCYLALLSFHTTTIGGSAGNSIGC